MSTQHPHYSTMMNLLFYGHVYQAFAGVLPGMTSLGVQHVLLVVLLRYLNHRTDGNRPELGTRYFFPGSLIANSLFLDHGSLSLNR